MLDNLQTRVGFNAALAALLLLGPVVLTRNDRLIGLPEAAWLTGLWIIVAAAAGAVRGMRPLSFMLAGLVILFAHPRPCNTPSPSGDLCKSPSPSGRGLG